MKMQNINPFGLRMQPSLRKKLEDSAKGKPKWSLNSEIEQRLEESFHGRRNLTDFADGELIQELLNRYGRDGIFIRIGREQAAPSAIQEAVNALNEKLNETGADHAEKNRERNQNR